VRNTNVLALLQTARSVTWSICCFVLFNEYILVVHINGVLCALQLVLICAKN
jgi:hypothetical protein